MLDLILARNLDNVISIEDMLPWNCLDDLRRFKLITSRYEFMVMGRKTFESLPNILEGRKHLVITSRPEIYTSTNQVIYCSIAQVEEIVQTCKGICIGGAKTACELMPYIDTIFLTTIHKHNPDNIDLLTVKKFEYPFQRYFKKKMEQAFGDHTFTIYER